MKDNKLISNIKLIELARLFISEYGYHEIKLKNIEGVFLENKERNFPLIRISLQENSSLADFNRELANLKRMQSEYSVVSAITEPKLLAIYFSGEVETKVDNIYSVVLNTNNDIINSEIIQSEYPTVIEKFDLEKYNEEKLKEQSSLLKSDNKNPNERKILEMFSIKEMNKKTKFTRIFAGSFLIINIMLLYLTFNRVNYEMDFGFYTNFIFNLDQYYRIITGLFLGNSLISAFIYAFFFYQYNMFIEIKLGTRKTIALYGISLIAIYLAMFSLGNGAVMFGPYPILCVIVGAFVSILLLPSEAKMIKFHTRNLFFMLILFVAIGFISTVHLPTAIVGFLAGFILVRGLNLKEEKANNKYIGLVLVASLVMMLFNFIPNQTLNRSYLFEEEYFKYHEYYNKEKAVLEKEKMEAYYDEIGAVEYE